MLNESIKDAEVKLTIFDGRINTVIDLKTENEHEVDELNFTRPAQVITVKNERQILSSYGPIQFDCNCATGKRIDFQACEPIEGVSFKDVSFIFK